MDKHAKHNQLHMLVVFFMFELKSIVHEKIFAGHFPNYNMLSCDLDVFLDFLYRITKGVE